MKTNKKRDNSFLQILQDAKQAFNNATPLYSCPDSDQLMRYACKDAVQQETETMAAHLQSCESCRMTVLRIEADQILWNDLFNNSPDAALNQALGDEGRREINALIREASGKQSAISAEISKIKENLIAWVSPLWQPMYAGEALTAADMEEQSIHFDMDYGEYIDLKCHWQDEKDGQPGIDVSWQANLLQPSRIWVRFIDPDSKRVLSEILLGTELEGRLYIEGDELAFNPFENKWAIAVVTEEL